jgi:hypothetical protein
MLLDSRINELPMVIPFFLEIIAGLEKAEKASSYPAAVDPAREISLALTPNLKIAPGYPPA